MTSSINREQVLDHAARFLELARDAKSDASIARIGGRVDAYRLGLFRLVVMGEVKKGKSSFINALLGIPDLLPTSNDVATSTVFKILYGPERKVLAFHYPPDDSPDWLPPPPTEIAVADIPQYGTESGNPGNRRRVDFIGLQVPSPLLRGGISVIDTPGLGGLFQKHRDITWRYLPNADAVVFVVDSVESVIGQAELDALKKLRELNPLIIFVQTKTDLVEEAHWQAWRQRNLAILAQALGTQESNIAYFPLSAKLKFAADAGQSMRHLERSGFRDFLAFLQNKLIATRDDLSGRSLLALLGAEAAHIRDLLAARHRVASTVTKEGLDSLEKQYAEAKTAVERWRSGEHQKAVSEFNNRMADLRREARDELAVSLDPSSANPLVRDVVERVRSGEWTADKIVESLDELSGEVTESCHGIVSRAYRDFATTAEKHIAELTTKLGKSLDAEIGAAENPITLPKDGARLHVQDSTFDTVRTGFYGASFGAGVASAVGLLIGLSVPLVGLAIAGCIGFALSSSNRESQRSEQVIMQLERQLVDLVRRTQSQALRQMTAFAERTDREVTAAINKAVLEIERDVTSQMREINQQRQRSSSEASHSAAALNTLVERAQSFIADVAALTSVRGIGDATKR